MWNVSSKFPVSLRKPTPSGDIQQTFPTEPLAQIVEEWLLSEDLAETSRAAYRRNLKPYFHWLEKTSRQLNSVTRKDALEFKRYLMEIFSGHTAANYFSAMSRFHLWLEGKGVYPNVTQGIRGVRARKGFRKDPLTLDQIGRLFNSIDRATLEGKRDYCLLRLLLGTGIRGGELVFADAGDARQTTTGETALYIKGKGRQEKDAYVILVPGVLEAINEYFVVRGKVGNEDPLIGSVSDGNRHQRITTRSLRRIVKKRFRAIGINSPRITCHSLRHTATTLSLVAGATLQETAAMCRHASITTTASVYDHSLERVAKAAEKKLDVLLSKVISNGTTDAVK